MSDRLVDRVIYLLESDPEGWTHVPETSAKWGAMAHSVDIAIHRLGSDRLQINETRLGFWESRRLGRAVTNALRLRALAKVNKAIGFDPVEPAATMNRSAVLRVGVACLTGAAAMSVWVWVLAKCLG